MAPSTAEDDAASEAHIEQLIAEDFSVNFDACRIGGSLEDYEEPLSSYERELLEGPENVNNGDDSTLWGDPTVINAGEGDSSMELVPREPINDGWDAGVASHFDDEIPDTTNSEHGEQEKQDDIDYKGRSTSHHLSDEIYTRSGAEMNGLTQTGSVPGHVPCQPVEEPRTKISDLEANVTSIASLPTQPDLPPGKQYIGYTGPAETHAPPRPPTPQDPEERDQILHAWRPLPQRPRIHRHQLLDLLTWSLCQRISKGNTLPTNQNQLLRHVHPNALQPDSQTKTPGA